MQKASDLFIRCLENEGVEYIFGIPGEENIDVMDALLDSSIQFVTTRHEQGAAFMADVNGRGAFTHTSYNDYEIVAANLFDDDPRRVSDRILCYGLFVDPPLGRIGMTEKEVRASGRRALVGKRMMTRVGRAREFGETRGFIKIIVDADSGEILGAAILGLNGDEAIHCLLDTMYAGKPYTTVSRAVHIHPLVAELIPTVLQDLKPLD